MLSSFRHSVLIASFAVLAYACTPRGGSPSSKAASASLTASYVDTSSSKAKVAPAVSVAHAAIEEDGPHAVKVVAYDSWKGFGISKCSYLAPKQDFVRGDGAVDVVFHFHAGQMSEREIRESAVNGVFVSCGFGMGSAPYSNAFADPNRFGQMVTSLMWTLGQEAGRKVHLGRLALVSWSAGFASVGRILSVPKWYAATDTVVLLDSLHAPYTEPEGGPAQGEDHVVLKAIGNLVRFAEDASYGKKTMVITHSSIIPPDYASSTEATRALLGAIDVPVEDVADEPGPRGMRLFSRADSKDLHVRGYRGQNASDHFDHLHLVGEELRAWLVPKWRRAP
jgi:hypothetical protein